MLNKQLSPDANIPVYSANVKEPFGYINELLITDFTVPSVLWGIDGDWMTAYMPKNVKFYPTDHCGVLRCKSDEVNPIYMTHILEREGTKAGFSRSYRASIDRIKGISFNVPDINAQNKVIKQVESLITEIKKLNKKAIDLKDKESEIFNNYLNS